MCESQKQSYLYYLFSKSLAHLQYFINVYHIPFFILLFLAIVASSGYIGLGLGALYVIYMILDRNSPTNGRYVHCVDCYWSISSHYFPIDIKTSEAIDQSKNYLVGIYPHGLIGFSQNAFNNRKRFVEIFGEKSRYHLAVANLLFKVPLMRDYVLLCARAIDASGDALRHNLNQTAGSRVVALFPGGTKEALLYASGSHHLQSRKGFFKIALETGASLLPAYAFGEFDIGHVYWNNKLLQKLAYFTYQKLNVAFLISHPFPKKVPLTLVLGRPLHVTRTEKPTKEQIEALQTEYVQELIKIFESNKAKYMANSADEFLVFEE